MSILCVKIVVNVMLVLLRILVKVRSDSKLINFPSFGLELNNYVVVICIGMS